MLRFMTIEFFAFHTSSTGMPAIGLVGSSCAAGFTMSLAPITIDRKSTRLNSSHVEISYAVFCLKKKKKKKETKLRKKCKQRRTKKERKKIKKYVQYT